MNLISSSSSGLFAEPPLTPTPLASAVEPPVAPAPAVAPAPPSAPVAPQPAPEPAPPAPSERREDLPIEAQLVRMGLLTLEQLAEANRTRLESGGTVPEIAVANGWVTPEQLAVLTNGASGPAPAAPEPAPIPVSAPAPVPAPAPEAAPQLRVAEPSPEPVAPAPAAFEPPAPAPVAGAQQASTFRIALHLTSGERVEVAAAPDEASAQHRAREIVFDLTRPRADEWPFYGGRFVRPDAIVSVDVFTD